MKKISYFFIMVSFAIFYTSCGQEEALTENPTYKEDATGDTQGRNINSGGGVIDTSSSTGGIQLPAGFLADTSSSNRVAVLEDFTGVRCGFCPDGHVRAEQIEASLGDDFIVIAIHNSGSYSAPQSGWPNFETPFGNAIKDQARPTGFPAGSVNRLPAEDLGTTPQDPASPPAMAMGRGSWSAAANSAVAMPSPVNIGAEATLSGTTLTVNVDVFYTDNETETNHINVALIQDSLIGNQSDFGFGGTDPNYNNSHVLRALIAGSNPQWGDPIAESTTKGAIVQKTYTYEVPADYNGAGPNGGGAVVNEDLKVVAFITRGQKDILTAVEVKVIL